MIPALGLYALILALSLAICLATLPLLGSFTQYQAWQKLARPLSYGQLGFVLTAYCILTYCFVTQDYSVAYVARNSSLQLPLWYRIPAVWGAHEGSILLWVLLLSVWTAAVAFFSRTLSDVVRSQVLAVLGWISTGFLLFILTTSNPFIRIFGTLPGQGAGLNPLLQDPGFLIHPPMLYMGYVGFSVAFAFAIMALLQGRLETKWIQWFRPWTLAAWCFLTLGITLGSWWAYRELGWGGWWFWDPVENASFMPWLTGTALLHALSVAQKQQAYKAWTILLAIVAFALSLLGTFLVRSGILTSVHAFAVDPKRGIFILAFLGFVIGSSILLYSWRGVRLRGQHHTPLLSRGSLLLANNVLLMVAMATVLLGTLYPIVIQLLHLGKLSVGAPYFNHLFIPLMAPLLLLLGVGTICSWQAMSIKQLWSYIRVPAMLTLLTFVITLGVSYSKPLVALGLALSCWIITTNLMVLRRLRREQQLSLGTVGMVLAHIGVAVTVIGITLTSAYTLDRNVKIELGQATTVGPYQFKLISVVPLQGPNYKGVEGRVEVYHQRKRITVLHPEKRFYGASQIAMNHASIAAGIWRDLYVALGDPLTTQAWSMRIYYKPFVRWIWGGGLLMLLGGGLAFVDKCRRVTLSPQPVGV